MDAHERRQWQNPEAILSGIGLSPGLTFVDIGCGDGFFARPAARMVGENGEVYGLDADAAAVARLKEQAARAGLNNMNLVVGRAEDVVLCRQCGDIVFFGMVLHDFQDPALVLKNARTMTGPGGKLVNLDWKKEPAPFGPPLGKRFDEETAAGLIRAAGFTIETIEDSGPYHYLVTARP